MAKRRRNPGKSKGLPHKSSDITKKASILSSPYDQARAELGLRKEVVEADDLASILSEKLGGRLLADQKKKEIVDFSKGVDFRRHLEAVVAFKFDIEGFLAALKTKFGSDPQAKEMYTEYTRVYRKLKELIDTLKAI
jgi:hypothetical protein